MIEGLKLESNKLKLSFNYMRSLKDHEKIKYSIDFNSFFKTSGKWFQKNLKLNFLILE